MGAARAGKNATNAGEDLEREHASIDGMGAARKRPSAQAGCKASSRGLGQAEAHSQTRHSPLRRVASEGRAPGKDKALSKAQEPARKERWRTARASGYADDQPLDEAPPLCLTATRTTLRPDFLSVEQGTLL